MGIAEGEFRASGAIADAGEVRDEFRVADGTLRIVRTLTGDRGAITMRIEAASSS